MTATLDKITVEVTVVLGRAQMPIHRMLRMGRGSVVELETGENDEVEILANNFPIAKGQVVVNGEDISVEITEIIRKPENVRSVSEALAGLADLGLDLHPQPAT